MNPRGGPARPIQEVLATMTTMMDPKPNSPADLGYGEQPPPLHSPHQCKSCSAPIYWARTEAGKSMPVDAAPTSDGTVVLTDRRGTVMARVLRRDEQPPPGAKLRKPHFQSCPHAADWRAAKRAKKAAERG